MLFNVRLGHATNSSSTHSIIIDPGIAEFGIPEKYQYGWEDFFIRNREQKVRYFAVLIYQNLCYSLGEDYARRITKQLFSGDSDSLPKVEIPFTNSKYEVYIDHQSVISLPGRYDNPNELDFDFVHDFYNHVVENDNVGIAGGNDNQYPEEKVNYGGRESPIMQLPQDSNPHGKLICRKDGDYWIVFNKQTGAKIRLSFRTNEPYLFSTTPELVDIKITNYCPFGCNFCYQNSTTEGKHAKMDTVDSIIMLLQELQVLEVAIGGGETTMHPHFAKIITNFSYYDIVPNFTTFTMKWADNPLINSAVAEHCGGFALSIDNEANGFNKLHQLNDWVKKHECNNGRTASVQMILGINSDDFIVHVIETMRSLHLRNLTLLGYKSFGRGLTIAPKHCNNIHRLIETAEKHHIRLGVDTQVVKHHKNQLTEAGISKLLWTADEGKFSCYIDAVEKTFARDSYSDNSFPFDTKYGGEKYLSAVIAEHYPFVT